MLKHRVSNAGMHAKQLPTQMSQDLPAPPPMATSKLPNQMSVDLPPPPPETSATKLPHQESIDLPPPPMDNNTTPQRLPQQYSVDLPPPPESDYPMSPPQDPGYPDDPPPPPPEPEYTSTNAVVGGKKDNAYDSIDGIRRINEKYDSVENIMPPGISISPAVSDGGQFSFPDIISKQKFRQGVNEHDLLQVETFYKSHKSEVYVCGCLANMYLGSLKSPYSQSEWTFQCTGILALLLDTGEHHRQRKLYILMAEKGTGFALWKDTIDNMTGYKTPSDNFHTMHVSTDHTKLAGFSFDDAGLAAEFFSHIDKLTSDPSDDLLKIGKITKKKKSVKEKKKKIKLPKKSEISQPCCFVHVTKIDRPMDVQKDSTGEHTDLISQPYNFTHNSLPSGTGSEGLSSSFGSHSNLTGSKLTLASNESNDSGLSEDRGSSKTEKS